MGPSALSLARLLTAPFAAAFSIPSPLSVNSVYTSSQHRSVLLLSPQTQSNGAASCAALGETLLPVNQTFFTTELVHSLDYLVYEDAYGPTQLFWVGEVGSCQAIDVLGQVVSIACDDTLPVLCSQSAAYGAPATSTNTLTVSAGNSSITGYRDQVSFRFEGIPYADLPARFTYSTPYTGSPDINATDFGAVCVQAGVPDSSEDCLFLNIWTPYIPASAEAAPTVSLKPIVFWIHGGAFTSGTGADPTSDGGNMASRGDVVVVTINYRLSTLGFLALADGVTNGNFGLADAVLALNWVREHITAFGGDPNCITIYGQSAGAAAVRALLQSPQAIGKYAAAIPGSNLAGSDYATTYSLYYTIPEEVDAAVVPLLEEIGCTLVDALECLRAYNAYDLVNLENVARFLVVDGTYLIYPELPLNDSGTVANVHTMMGYMRDDGAAFIGYPTNGNLTEALIAQYLPTTVVNSTLFAEPTGPNITLDVYNVTARVSSNVQFRCLDQATAWSAVQHDLIESVWFYQFNRSYQGTGWDPNYPVCNAPITEEYPYGDPNMEYFKCHSGDLYYEFATLPSTLPYRDDNDLLFMQTRVTSSREVYLYSSLEQFAKEDTWLPMTNETLATTPSRTLQISSFMAPFAEQAQCKFLGYPLNYYG